MDHDNSFQAILNVLGSVPHGSICTYGKIAELAGYPSKSRYVGYILKNLPSDSTLPWHRIINAQGRISFPLHSEKHTLQRSLLESEGIHFLHDRIKLRTFLWQG